MKQKATITIIEGNDTLEITTEWDPPVKNEPGHRPGIVEIATCVAIKAITALAGD